MSVKAENLTRSAWATAEIELRVLPAPQPTRDVQGPSAAPAESEPPQPEEDRFMRWFVRWGAPPGRELRIGEELTVVLVFGETLENAQTVPVPRSSPVVNVFFDVSPGLQVNGERRRTLAASDGKLLVTELSCRVTALLPGDQEVRAVIYPGREVEGATPPEVRLALSVAEPVDEFAQPPDPTPIPWPAPDLQLYVALRPARPASADGKAAQPEQLDVYATCPALLPARLKPYIYSIAVTRADAAALREAAARHALAARRGGDAVGRLRKFGMALFDALAPEEDRADAELSLRELLFEASRLAARASRPFTCLIISDEGAGLPWELAVPFMIRKDVLEETDFLALRFSLAQWFGRLGLRLADEVPLRRFEIAHYSQQADELAYWQALFGGETRAAVRPGTDGFAVNDPGSEVVGIHLLRYMDRSSGGEIRSAGAETEDRFEAATRNRRLSFAARRPLVTLSLVEEAPAAARALNPIRLEQDYALLFLGAEASAVVGPRWPVAVEVDRLFYRLLYEQLDHGRRLGEAVQLARAWTAAAYPQSGDWLAYALFGHPGAEPYIVTQAAAYSLFEVLQPDPDAPLEPGKTYEFRASYGVEMPVSGRVYFAPELPETTAPRVVVLADHLDGPVRQPLVRIGEHLEQTLRIEMPENETSVTFNVWFKDGKRDLDSQLVSFELGGEAH